MRLKIYDLKEPRSGIVDIVYEYPQCLASPTLIRNNATLVSKEPLRIPIFVVPNEYLTERSDERASSEFLYASFDLIDYFDEQANKKDKQEKYDDKVEKLKSLFAVGDSHKKITSTTFFTGPKEVYKKTYADVWAWSEDKLKLGEIGYYESIENLSLKGLNEVFLKGTFKCGEVTQRDTQCKITLSVK